MERSLNASEPRSNRALEAGVDARGYRGLTAIQTPTIFGVPGLKGWLRRTNKIREVSRSTSGSTLVGARPMRAEPTGSKWSRHAKA